MAMGRQERIKIAHAFPSSFAFEDTVFLPVKTLWSKSESSSKLSASVRKPCERLFSFTADREIHTVVSEKVGRIG
jgi:hypothetical protein